MLATLRIGPGMRGALEMSGRFVTTIVACVFSFNVLRISSKFFAN